MDGWATTNDGKGPPGLEIIINNDKYKSDPINYGGTAGTHQSPVKVRQQIINNL